MERSKVSLPVAWMADSEVEMTVWKCSPSKESTRRKLHAPRPVQASGYSRFGELGGRMKRHRNGLFHLADAWAMDHGPPWDRIAQSSFWEDRTDCGRRKARAPSLEEYDNQSNAWVARWNAARLWNGAVQGAYRRRL